MSFALWSRSLLQGYPKLLRAQARWLSTEGSVANDHLLEAARATLAGRLQDGTGHNRQSEALSDAYKQLQEHYKLLASLSSIAKDDKDPGMRELAADDLATNSALTNSLRATLQRELLPEEEHDTFGALLEVKAGVGGTEAAVFAADLLRMYTKLAARKSWKTSVLDSAPVLGPDEAYRNAMLEFDGAAAFAILKHEVGVHRVQRVPTNDTAGRIHTSTAAVIVFPLVPAHLQTKEDLYQEKDIKEEVMRSRGAGGQHVNKTESAVRLTHIPTGVTVSMQDSRSQQQNRVKAYTVLRSRLMDLRIQQEQEARRTSRKLQVKANDRADKIRTYNYPQDRITDHRLPLTVNNMESIMAGGETFDIITDALQERQDDERLAELIAAS